MELRLRELGVSVCLKIAVRPLFRLIRITTSLRNIKLSSRWQRLHKRTPLLFLSCFLFARDGPPVYQILSTALSLLAHLALLCGDNSRRGGRGVVSPRSRLSVPHHHSEWGLLSLERNAKDAREGPFEGKKLGRSVDYIRSSLTLVP
jgi:hypothetical protein